MAARMTSARQCPRQPQSRADHHRDLSGRRIHRRLVHEFSGAACRFGTHAHGCRRAQSEFLCNSLLDEAARLRKKTYGFYRVEILAALLNGVFLILIALYIFYEAYDRFLDPQAVKADWMLLVAAIGLFANLVSAYLLFGKHQSLNVRGAFFHVVSDAIGSVGAILASLAIILGGYRSPIRSSARSSRC